MNSLIRVCCISNRMRSMRPDMCLDHALHAIEEMRENQPDILLLPTFALTSAGCGSLFDNILLLDSAKTALDELCFATADLRCYVVAGLVVDDWGKTAPVCAVLYRGEVVGLVPADQGAMMRFDGRYSDKVLPEGTVFGMGNCRFTVFSCAPDKLLLRTADIMHSGCDLVLCPSCAPVYAGYISEVRRAARLMSKTLGCAVALCNGGTGDTSSPYLFNGFVGIYECGEEMRFVSHKNTDTETNADSVIADIDMDVIGSQKQGGVYVKPYRCEETPGGKSGILRRIPQNPFMNCPNRDAYVGDLFALQVSSLMSRMVNSGIAHLIIGVSGGLDSTLALLVAARAMDSLRLPRENIHAVTMPGFGTSERTLKNAQGLMSGLGCEVKEVSIRKACHQHLEDIGHSPTVEDVTFENAQARERTQILFDMANMLDALVLGTGDLSEAALGWCTFGGDHLAGYNVNVCLTKNLIRAVVKYAAESDQLCNTEVCGILVDILETPVSPELLPAVGGVISQKTEDILGKYDLHDFFTYYLVKYGFRPAKLFRYACVAFGSQISSAEIKEKLRLFLKRFFGAQFKRSCAPDAASITEVNLLGQQFQMPSDASCKAFLDEVEQITLAGEE